MDTDEAWDDFRTKSFQKASVQEQLDTLAAAINEIRADTSRTAEIVPQIMGDNAAIDQANADAGMGAAMSGAPDMMGGMGGDEMNMTDEQMPEEGEDIGAEAGADMGADLGADMGEGVPGAEDMSPDMGGEMPPIEGGDEYEGEEQSDYMSDEDLDALLESIYGDIGGEESDIPEEGTPNPMIPSSGGAGLAEATNNLVAALKQAAHEAVDANDIDRVVQLSHMEQQIMQTLGGEVGAVEANSTTGSVPDAGAPIPEEQIPEDLPFDPEAAPDVSEVLTPEEEGEEMIAEEEIAPVAEPEKDEAAESDEKGDDSEEEKSEEEEDDDSESTKKSMTCEGDADPESFEKDGECDGMSEGEFGEEIATVAKSSVPPSPSFRDMMDGKVDMVAFMKGNAEGYIDEAEIYKDPMVDGMESGVDGKSSFMKADDRIATARSIFDRPMGRSGHQDPGSVATAGEAQEALDHTGEQDPDSVSTADKIIDVKKSAEDIGEILTSSGSTDPASIASSGSAQEALSHTGEQDPDSVASADKAVDMSSGNDSEGTDSSVDISIEKAAKPRSFSEGQIRQALLQATGNNVAQVDKIIADMVRRPNMNSLESYDEGDKGHDDEDVYDSLEKEDPFYSADLENDSESGSEPESPPSRWRQVMKEKGLKASQPTPIALTDPSIFEPSKRPNPSGTPKIARGSEADNMSGPEPTPKSSAPAASVPAPAAEDMAVDLPEPTPYTPRGDNGKSAPATPYSRPYEDEPSIGSLIQKYEPDSPTAYHMYDQGPTKKSAGGKHLVTLNEAFAIAKSGARPNMASAMGDAADVDLNSIRKSSKPVVKMGRGVDPMKVIENDLEDWNLYKARNKF